MVYSEAQTLGAGKRFDLVSQARKTMLRLKSLSDTLSALASAVRAESRAARANFDAVKNMCGLASLPNELLSRIFECVVNGDPGPQKSTAVEDSRRSFTCLSIFSGYCIILSANLEKH